VLGTAAVNLNVKNINISLSGGRWCDCCVTCVIATTLQLSWGKINETQ